MKEEEKKNGILFLCKKCHKNIDKNEPIVSHTPVVNLTGERQPIFSLFYCVHMHVLPEVIDGIFSSLLFSSRFFFVGTNEQRKNKMRCA
jgi:hypothetical protein